MYTNKINKKLIKYRKYIQQNIIKENNHIFAPNMNIGGASTIMISFKDICESVREEEKHKNEKPLIDTEKISQLIYNFLKRLKFLYGNPQNNIDKKRYSNFTRELKILILENISPKIIINRWKFSKKQIIEVLDLIKRNINKNIINYHEPIGIKVSQTSGETFTQAALKSIHSKKTVITLKTLEEQTGYQRIKELLELKNIEFNVIYINLFNQYKKEIHEEYVNKILEVYVSDLLLDKFSCEIIDNLPFNTFKKYFEFIPNPEHEIVLKEKLATQYENDIQYLSDGSIGILPWMILIKLDKKLMLYYNILISEITFMIEQFYAQKNALFIKYILTNGYDEILICFSKDISSSTLLYDIESVKANILASSIYAKVDTEFDFRIFSPIKIKGLKNFRNTNLLEINNNIYKSDNGALKTRDSYKIISNGTSLSPLLKMADKVDINKCFTSNYKYMNKYFGILAAKETYVWELKKAYGASDLKDFLDKQLIFMANFMTSNGYFVSITRNTYNLIEGMSALQKVTFENIKDFFKTETIHAKIESANTTFGCSLFGIKQNLGSNSGIVIEFPEQDKMTIGEMLE